MVSKILDWPNVANGVRVIVDHTFSSDVSFTLSTTLKAPFAGDVFELDGEEYECVFVHEHGLTRTVEANRS